eukprot:4118536-Ditylum_brightwellii.AAC.1
MIDPATLWFEIKAITNKEGKTVVLSVDREWFCCYPRPREVMHDQGGGLLGWSSSTLKNMESNPSRLQAAILK